MSRYPVPAPPVVGGVPAHHSGENNHPPTLIVVHSAVIACKVGNARLLAAWNRDGTTAGSWHYAVDPAETIQCSYDRFVCWHAPPNGHTIGIEMCDMPAPVPTVRGRALAALRKSWRWRDLEHRRTLERTADLVAGLLLAYDLPPCYVGVNAQRNGGKGWTTHAARSLAFGQSTHWDPGFWPRRRFGRMVARRYARLKAAHDAAAAG